MGSKELAASLLAPKWQHITPSGQNFSLLLSARRLFKSVGNKFNWHLLLPVLINSQKDADISFRAAQL